MRTELCGLSYDISVCDGLYHILFIYLFVLDEPTF